MLWQQNWAYYIVRVCFIAHKPNFPLCFSALPRALSDRVILSPDKWSWCYHSCQECWSKLQKQDSGCWKWNFPGSRMTSLSKNLSCLSHGWEYTVRTLPSDTHTHTTDVRLLLILASLWQADSHRGEAAYSLLISTDQRQSMFVWTDKRGVERHTVWISPSHSLSLEKTQGSLFSRNTHSFWR